MIVQNLSNENAFEEPMSSQIKIVWNQCLETIKAHPKVHEQSFVTWFKPIKLVDISDNKFILNVPSQFLYDWIEVHYPEIIRDAVKQIMGQSYELEYVVHNTPNSMHLNNIIQESELKNHIKTSQPDFDTKLNPKNIFKNFIEGDGNKFAKAAALAVAEAPGQTAFNPLVIYGGTGLGKTHLMQAIGNFALEQGKVDRVYYSTSEQFTSDFINSIQNNSISNFSSKYRSIDLLLIDDIQFFSNKGKTQEEFFHTFNSLHMAGKQIVLSSDRPPSELKDLQERLLSRFQWGLQVDIQPPDFETRIAILQQMAAQNKVEMSYEIIEYLASNITASIRELQGALIRLLAQASINGEDMTLELTKSIIQKIGKAKSEALTIENIIKTTSEYFNLQENLLLSKTRKKEIVIARQISMYLSKIYTNHTVKSIGLHFGGRDHTTVLYSVKMVEDQLEYDSRLAKDVKNIREKLDKMENNA